MMSGRETEVKTDEQGEVRVVIVTRNLLLGDVLENLLPNVFRLSYPSDLYANADVLQQAIDHYQPEVVVLEEGLIGDTSNPLLSQSLNYGRARLILVNPEENRVHVYDKFQISLTRAADLLALVEHFPGHPMWPVNSGGR
jgi:hypothetical protein